MPSSVPSRHAGLAAAGLVVALVVGVVVGGPTRAGSGQAASAAAGPAAAATRGRRPAARRATPAIAWRHSRALGLPYAGQLRDGVQLPAEGAAFVTWDPVRQRSPSPGWRRWGTDRLLRTLLRVVDGYAHAHPGAQRLVVGDLSLPHGGPFGRAYGGDGHRSHQNGLDVDVYYPRRDGRALVPRSPGEIDRALAQDLVDRFVRAGAALLFVGPHTGLRGPAAVVQPLRNHDDHVHVRIRPG
jgi:murein endopeptidase